MEPALYDALFGFIGLEVKGLGQGVSFGHLEGGGALSRVGFGIESKHFGRERLGKRWLGFLNLLEVGL